MVIKRCGFTFFLLCLSFCLLFSFVCSAEGETQTEPATQTVTETSAATITVTSTLTNEAAESNDPVSETVPHFDDPATWIVFILALLVGIFLGQALSFWKW